eukprot:5140834-Prymnesium_polylepis.1
MNLYPNHSVCPEDEYNLWTPFAYDLLEGEYERDDDALALFLHHMSCLCDHDEAVTDFVLMWLAQMIQYPENKSIVVAFISREGAGKGLLVQLITVWFGKKKVISTENAKRDVFGDFNSQLLHAFFCNLNELSAKDFYDAYGRYKAMVTDPTITINQKGKDQIEMKSCHRFMASSNNEDCMPTHEGDRRQLLIRSSNELIGDQTHTDKMVALKGNVSGMRTIWDHLKHLKCPKHIDHTCMPITSFHQDIKKQNQSPIMHWIEDM